MRNLHTFTRHHAASGWLRAGILGLLLATCATLVAPTTGGEPVHATSAHAAIATVHITEVDTREAVTAVHGGDIVVSQKNSDDPLKRTPTGVYAWAG